MAARRCALFEKQEYKRGIVDFEKLVEDGITVERDYTDSQYVSPKKIVEKQRVFEFLMGYFGKETDDRKIDIDEMNTICSTLTTQLKKPKQPTAESNKDTRQELDIIFDNINELIDNDEDGAMVNLVNEESDDDETNASNADAEQIEDMIPNCKVVSHHKHAFTDIIEQGMIEVEKKDYIVIRYRKKKRQKRVDKFIKELYEKIMAKHIAYSPEVSWLNDNATSDTPFPTFSTQFCLMKLIK